MNDQNKSFEDITAEDIKNALADEEIERDEWLGLPIVFIDDVRYMVAENEQKAFEACCEYVEDNLCYFCPEFLAEQTELPIEIFEALASKDFHDNSVYKSLIEHVTTIENFTQAAIDADGRGHFLNSWDGSELEIGEYLLYRLD